MFKYILHWICKFFINNCFRSQAYDAEAIQVGPIPDGIVNEAVEFESKCYININLRFHLIKISCKFTFIFLICAVDGSKAGSGNLEILVNGGHVTSFVTSLDSQRFLASFVPHEAVSHLIEMTFNGEIVPGKL